MRLIIRKYFELYHKTKMVNALKMCTLIYYYLYSIVIKNTSQMIIYYNMRRKKN